MIDEEIKTAIAYKDMSGYYLMMYLQQLKLSRLDNNE